MPGYLREAAQASRATSRRRLYGYISAAVIVSLLLAVMFWNMPIWLFFAIVVASFALDAILVRKWINEDLLSASGVQQ